MARRSVLAARRGWMRPTGSARFRAGCPHAPLGSHRDRPSIAHRPWAPRAQHSPPSAPALERCPAPSCSSSIATSGRARSTRLPRRRSLATAPACATRWCHGKPAYTGRTSQRALQTPLLAALGSPVVVQGSKSVATSGVLQITCSAGTPGRRRQGAV